MLEQSKWDDYFIDCADRNGVSECFTIEDLYRAFRFRMEREQADEVINHFIKWKGEKDGCL